MNKTIKQKLNNILNSPTQTFKETTQIFNMERLRQLAMGLQGQIDTKVQTSNFVDNETPTGAINGSNKTFTLAYTPNPATSLKVYRNGIRQELTTHYTLSGKTLTTVTALPSGTNLKVDYTK